MVEPVAESMLNPVALFMAADWVVRGVMIGLAVASVWSWAVIIGGTDEASQVIALACPKNRFNGGVNLSSFGGYAADYIAYTSLF